MLKYPETLQNQNWSQFKVSTAKPTALFARFTFNLLIQMKPYGTSSYCAVTHYSLSYSLLGGRIYTHIHKTFNGLSFLRSSSIKWPVGEKLELGVANE